MVIYSPVKRETLETFQFPVSIWGVGERVSVAYKSQINKSIFALREKEVKCLPQ